MIAEMKTIKPHQDEGGLWEETGTYQTTTCHSHYMSHYFHSTSMIVCPLCGTVMLPWTFGMGVIRYNRLASSHKLLFKQEKNIIRVAEQNVGSFTEQEVVDNIYSAEVFMVSQLQRSQALFTSPIQSLLHTLGE
ncbi:hypothetical protein CEXT_258631 [Caerostris extrusa]|uniref:Uncharacterized protein n=1 Tax=Caerostris extrusa TaxID=172846 RepID=A0AAV4M2S6_CAEEX|nr:hypothetical protein CEXT_258631 [Caerostris extrusa]